MRSLGGLGLGMISMTNITVEVDLIYVLGVFGFLFGDNCMSG